ncbi:DNA repair protein RadA [Synechococcus elongatus]|uniref:DNA repair protein RadA n=1 Tax=Synechococcus elongatus TaxID=32046 RepID=UPI0030CFC5EE
MARSRSEYVCQNCGHRAPRYVGRCPACESWNSLVEEAIAPTAKTPIATVLPSRQRRDRRADSPPQAVAAQPLSAIEDVSQQRIPSGSGEFDRVLGGGLVPGSLVLIGGDPGIGKSTLLLQTATALSQRQPILYVCAEESGQQVKLRWQRIAAHRTPNQTDQQFYLLPEIDLDAIVAELEALRPPVAIIDSIQALYSPALGSAPGSVAQVRECTAALMRVAKQLTITLLIVGHVTKDGAIAGPKVLEHLVDTVLYFEGDRFASHRLLRSVKNRFGASQELGIFEMVDRGLEEVGNPSALFLGSRDQAASGTATIVACEGTRPLLVELQALVSPSSYSSPRRAGTGIEYNRLLQILAVLEKRLGLPLSKFDAYVASAGGLNVAEPAADLGIAIALVASFRDRCLRPDTVLIGEIGLGGQVRPVSQIELRLKEAAKLGFQRALLPKGQERCDSELEMVPVSRLVDAIGLALQEAPTNSDRPAQD